MIVFAPYAVVALVALFTQRHFWKSWAICNTLAILYHITLGRYLDYQELGISYPLSLASAAGVILVAADVFVISLLSHAVFGGVRAFLWATGRAYWKESS
jgi:hypothetical protein